MHTDGVHASCAWRRVAGVKRYIFFLYVEKGKSGEREVVMGDGAGDCGRSLGCLS